MRRVKKKVDGGMVFSVALFVMWLVLLALHWHLDARVDALEKQPAVQTDGARTMVTKTGEVR